MNEERLIRLEEQCKRLENGQVELKEAVEEQTHWLRRVLYGNGGQPGHQVRIDRLEQRWSAARWFFGAIITLIGIGLTASLVL